MIGKKELKTMFISRKHINRKHTTKIILNGQRLKLGMMKGRLFLLLQLNTVLEVLVNRIRQEKKVKVHRLNKKKQMVFIHR